MLTGMELGLALSYLVSRKRIPWVGPVMHKEMRGRQNWINNRKGDIWTQQKLPQRHGTTGILGNSFGLKWIYFCLNLGRESRLPTAFIAQPLTGLLILPVKMSHFFMNYESPDNCGGVWPWVLRPLLFCLGRKGSSVGCEIYSKDIALYPTLWSHNRSSSLSQKIVSFFPEFKFYY
jgi:hypothetical protein